MTTPAASEADREADRLPTSEAVAAEPARRKRLPAGAVAVTKLRERLSVVWRELGEAGDPLADPEAVHRLRVATRRSLAALAAFAAFIPANQRQPFQRRLRQVRRAAGKARDLDVLIDRLRQQWPTAPAASQADSPPERLIGLLAEHQIASRGPIRDCQAELMAWGWPSRQEQLLEAITVTGRPRYGRFAHQRLKQVGRKFFASNGPFRKADQLHQFRILGKRLRYSLDLFADALAPQPRDRCLKQLKKMQEALGDFTDHAAAANRFVRLADEPLDTATLALVDSLRREEHQLARLSRRRFDRWWTDKRRKALKRLFRKALT